MSDLLICEFSELAGPVSVWPAVDRCDDPEWQPIIWELVNSFQMATDSMISSVTHIQLLPLSCNASFNAVASLFSIGDIQARGYCRRLVLATINKNRQKLIRESSSIVELHSKCIEILKAGNYIILSTDIIFNLSKESQDSELIQLFHASQKNLKQIYFQEGLLSSDMAANLNHHIKLKYDKLEMLFNYLLERKPIDQAVIYQYINWNVFLPSSYVRLIDEPLRQFPEMILDVFYDSFQDILNSSVDKEISISTPKTLLTLSFAKHLLFSLFIGKKVVVSGDKVKTLELLCEIQDVMPWKLRVKWSDKISPDISFDLVGVPLGTNIPETYVSMNIQSEVYRGPIYDGKFVLVILEALKVYPPLLKTLYKEFGLKGWMFDHLKNQICKDQKTSLSVGELYTKDHYRTLTSLSRAKNSRRNSQSSKLMELFFSGEYSESPDKSTSSSPSLNTFEDRPKVGDLRGIIKSASEHPLCSSSSQATVDNSTAIGIISNCGCSNDMLSNSKWKYLTPKMNKFGRFFNLLMGKNGLCEDQDVISKAICLKILNIDYKADFLILQNFIQRDLTD